MRTPPVMGKIRVGWDSLDIDFIKDCRKIQIVIKLDHKHGMGRIDRDVHGHENAAQYRFSR